MTSCLTFYIEICERVFDVDVMYFYVIIIDIPLKINHYNYRNTSNIGVRNKMI